MTQVTGVCIGGCADGEIKSGYSDGLTVPAAMDVSRIPDLAAAIDMRATVSHSRYRWAGDLLRYATEAGDNTIGAWVETRMSDEDAILHLFNSHASFNRNLLRRVEQYERGLRMKNRTPVAWHFTPTPWRREQRQRREAEAAVQAALNAAPAARPAPQETVTYGATIGSGKRVLDL